MGIDITVLPRRQITDEIEWKNAMTTIKREFEDDETFVEYSWGEGHGTNMILSDSDILGLEISESLMKPHYWRSVSKLFRMKKLNSAEDLANMIQKLSEDTKTNNSLYRYSDIPELKRAQLIVDKLSQQDKDVIFQMKGRDQSPLCPILFEFKVGEHPTLPVFGRHFNGFTSKLTGRCDARPYIEKVFRILRSYFPSNMVFDRDDDFPSSPSIETIEYDDRPGQRNHFYDVLRLTMPVAAVGMQMSEFHSLFVENLNRLAKIPASDYEDPKRNICTHEVVGDLDSDSDSDLKLFPARLSQIEGKGIGLIATRNIERGELILQERPIIDTSCVPQDIKLKDFTVEDIVFMEMCNIPTSSMLRTRLQKVRHLFEDLSGKEQSKVMQLLDVYEPKTDGQKTLFGCFGTNSVARGHNDPLNSLLCPLMSRLNHSCLPNATHFWAYPFERIVAMRDIDEGCEICTCYVELNAPRETRREELRKRYLFECCCEVCMLEGAALQASDKRRSEIAVIDDLILKVGAFDAKRGLQLIDRMFDTLKHEGLLFSSAQARHYYDAYQLACALEDIKSAKKFIYEAHRNELINEGENSISRCKMADYLRNPRSHFCWGCQR